MEKWKAHERKVNSLIRQTKKDRSPSGLGGKKRTTMKVGGKKSTGEGKGKKKNLVERKRQNKAAPLQRKRKFSKREKCVKKGGAIV